MINMFIKVEDLFTQSELKLLNNITVSSIDTEKLKETGTVEVTETEEDKIVTKTVNYESFDGSEKFTKVQRFYKDNSLYQLIKELNELIELNVKRDTVEGYQEAARLKTEKDNLLAKSV